MVRAVDAKSTADEFLERLAIDSYRRKEILAWS
jgi:hypothetical protein